MDGASLRSVPADTVVCREKEHCQGLYILQQGFAKEVVRSPGRATEATVHLLKPGETHGLISLMDGKECVCTLVTMQPCEFLVIPGEAFSKEIREHPAIHRQALDRLCYEVRQAHDWLRNLL